MIGTFGSSESIRRLIAKRSITKKLLSDSLFHTYKHFLLSLENKHSTVVQLWQLKPHLSSNIWYYWITVKLHQFENTIRPNLEACPFSMHVCKHAYEESPLKNSKFVYFYPICKITPSSTGNSQLTRIFWNFLRAVSCRGHNYVVHVFVFWDFWLTLQNGYFELMLISKHCNLHTLHCLNFESWILFTT